MDKIVYSDGELHIFRSDVRRPDFEKTFRNIDTVAKLKATLRAGEFAWPGGYQLYLICNDGETLCFDCGRKEFRLIASAVDDNDHSGLQVTNCDVLYEGTETCAHCNKTIVGSYEDLKETLE